jgi:hypothetical protein
VPAAPLGTTCSRLIREGSLPTSQPCPEERLSVSWQRHDNRRRSRPSVSNRRKNARVDEVSERRSSAAGNGGADSSDTVPFSRRESPAGSPAWTWSATPPSAVTFHCFQAPLQALSIVSMFTCSGRFTRTLREYGLSRRWPPTSSDWKLLRLTQLIRDQCTAPRPFTNAASSSRSSTPPFKS